MSVIKFGRRHGYLLTMFSLGAFILIAVILKYDNRPDRKELSRIHYGETTTGIKNILGDPDGLLTVDESCGITSLAGREDYIMVYHGKSGKIHERFYLYIHKDRIIDLKIKTFSVCCP